MQYTERQWESLDWVTLTLVACIIILVIAKYLYPKRFNEFIILPVTNKYFLVQGKNDEIGHPFNVLLFAVQVISVSLFIYLFFTLYDPVQTQTNPWLFLQICTGYVVFVIGKFCIEKIVGAVFSIDPLINGYLYQKLSYRNLLSLVFLLGNVLFFYTFPINYTIISVFVASILAFNGIALFYSYKSNGNLIYRHFFYFILYLCALEISPYILLYKVLA